MYVVGSFDFALVELSTITYEFLQMHLIGNKCVG